MKKLLISTIASLALATGAMAAGGGDVHIEDHDWSFEGPFGSYDTLQLQRGLQVFTEVCSACHGVKFVGFYALDDEGGPALPEAQVREYAKGFEVWNEKTKEYQTAQYSDHFPENAGVGAPDLSLMAKARAGFHGPYGLGINQVVKGMGGPEYIYSLLTGYTGHETEDGLHENTAYPSGALSMAPPLEDGIVTYADGSPETLKQYSEDVTAFLMWTAEPKLNQRKRGGMIAVLMLGFLSVLLFLANKALWYPVKHPRKED